MKAIKLASVFAVSAVAAAVSTSTMAADPVFSGSAGLIYTATDGSEAWSSDGEVNIKIDTGVVYIDLDMEGDTTGADGGFDLDEAYVTQGAVSFGDFDGSISGDARYTAGVYIEGEYEINDNPDLGIRYDTGVGLVAALEMTEDKDGVGFAFAYEASADALTWGVSAGTYTAEDDSVDAVTASIGASADLGTATILASYSLGEASDADFSSAVLGADITLSEALSVSAQYSADLENEENNFEITAYYTAGDIEYFVTNMSGDSEGTQLGATASF